MRKMRAIRIAKGGYIASSAALCLAGIFLLVHPDVSVLIFCRGLGILLVICGAFKMIGYLARDLYRLAFQFDLAFGIFMLVIGLIMVLKSSIVIRFANFALGIVVLTDGLFKIQMSVDARRFGLRQWWVGLIMVLKSSIVIRFANFALGIVVLTDGLFKIQMSVDARRFGLRQWWVIAAAAVLTSVFGLLIVLDPIRNTGVISVAVLLGIALVMRFGLRQWWVIAAAAVLTSVFGLLIVLDPIRNTGVISVAVLLGIALVMEGILNLCVAIWTVKIAEQRGMQASFQKGRPGGEDYD